MFVLAAFGFGLAHALFAEGRIATLESARLRVAALLFGGVVVLPVVGYFLHFYGDWSYLYLLPWSRVPSAVDLIIACAVALLPAAGAQLGVVLLRRDRRIVVVRAVAGLALAGVLLSLIAWRRVAHLGTHAQYIGDYGLRNVAQSSLGPSILLAGLTLAAGLTVSARLLRVR